MGLVKGFTDILTPENLIQNKNNGRGGGAIDNDWLNTGSLTPTGSYQSLKGDDWKFRIGHDSDHFPTVGTTNFSFSSSVSPKNGPFCTISFTKLENSNRTYNALFYHTDTYNGYTNLTIYAKVSVNDSSIIPSLRIQGTYSQLYKDSRFIKQESGYYYYDLVMIIQPTSAEGPMIEFPCADVTYNTNVVLHIRNFMIYEGCFVNPPLKYWTDLNTVTKTMIQNRSLSNHVYPGEIGQNVKTSTTFDLVNKTKLIIPIACAPDSGYSGHGFFLDFLISFKSPGFQNSTKVFTKEYRLLTNFTLFNSFMKTDITETFSYLKGLSSLSLTASFAGAKRGSVWYYEFALTPNQAWNLGSTASMDIYWQCLNKAGGGEVKVLRYATGRSEAIS